MTDFHGRNSGRRETVVRLPRDYRRPGVRRDPRLGEQAERKAGRPRQCDRLRRGGGPAAAHPPPPATGGGAPCVLGLPPPVASVLFPHHNDAQNPTPAP